MYPQATFESSVDVLPSYGSSPQLPPVRAEFAVREGWLVGWLV